jgi:hypothetical protein
LTNLEVPHGAGACTLELCRFIWCGEDRSAVKVSTCNTNPTILLSIAIWIVVLLGLVEKIDNNPTSDLWCQYEFSMGAIAADVTLID